MPTPTPSDVHIPTPEEKISVKVRPKYYLEAVPIFKTGKWKGTEYTIEDLDEIVRNTNALIRAGLHEPPIKLGHDENQEYLLNKSGLPSFGFVKRLYRVGNEIFADIEVPQEMVEWLEKRYYDKVSAEIYLDYEHPETGEKIGKVLRAIAFLGADLPAVKGLGSIILHNEKTKKIYVLFNDKDLEEAKTMNKWTLDEIKRILPCCYDYIKKYMEDKKKKELTGDELAELLVLKRFDDVKNANVQNQETTEQTIECPEGYKWDEKTGRCVRLDEKQEDRVVCPKGYKYNEETGRCEPVEQKQEENPNGEENEEVKEEIDEEGDIDEDVLFELLGKIVEKIEEFQLPGGTPKGWTRETFRTVYEKLGGSFDDCVEEVKARGIADNPERFCAWLKYRATGKWPGTKEWRASESVKDTKIVELQNKIKELENKKFEEEIEKIKTEYRNVLLPKFDDYIKVLSEEIKKVEVVKFGEKEVDLRKLFVDFLKDLVSSKIVMFGEVAKTPKEEEKYTISEERKQKIIQMFNEIKPNEEIDNLDLAELALQISAKENIPYRDALLKAKKILEEEVK